MLLSVEGRERRCSKSPPRSKFCNPSGRFSNTSEHQLSTSRLTGKVRLCLISSPNLAIFRPLFSSIRLLNLLYRANSSFLRLLGRVIGQVNSSPKKSSCNPSFKLMGWLKALDSRSTFKLFGRIIGWLKSPQSFTPPQ